MIPRMKSVGEEVGIDFSYHGFIGNTFDSYLFIWKAREIGGSRLQNKMDVGERQLKKKEAVGINIKHRFQAVGVY